MSGLNIVVSSDVGTDTLNETTNGPDCLIKRVSSEIKSFSPSGAWRWLAEALFRWWISSEDTLHVRSRAGADGPFWGTLSGPVLRGLALRERQVQSQKQNPGDEEQNAESCSEELRGAYLPLLLVMVRSITAEHRHGDLVLIPRYVSAEYKPNQRYEKKYQP